DIDEWCAAVPLRVRDRLEARLWSSGRFTRPLWRDASTALFQLRPALVHHFNEHQRRTEAAGEDVHLSSSQTPALEREALAFALEAWGGSRARKRTLLRAVPLTEPAPFLQGLAPADRREIDAIEH